MSKKCSCGKHLMMSEARMGLCSSCSQKVIQEFREKLGLKPDQVIGTPGHRKVSKRR